MDHPLNPEIHEVLDAIHYRPALSIVLPIEPRISLKTEMAHTLKIAADNAERELKRFYPEEQCELVMRKLSALVADLEIPAKKKSIAIYVSPVFAKVVYLDSRAEEKLIVDESFEIRDLLYDAKQAIGFILLVLSGQENRVFIGNRTSLNVLTSNIPQSIYSYVMDGPERADDFADMTAHKRTAIDHFLRHIDEELGNLINEHHLPVLVLGAERLLGEFKKLSKHTKSVMDYVEGNYENATIAELIGLVKPYLDVWQTRHQNQLLASMGDAAGQHRLATGIHQVWQDAHEGKGQLLIVEKNYRFAAQRGPEPGTIAPVTEPYNHFSYIRDAVDDVMEKVLKSGGDVEFTDERALEQFGHIALIKYY